MALFEQLIQSNVFVAWAALAAAFFLLFKCADLFVDVSVALANRFRVPRLFIGIVLVSLATTAPELSVSVIAALQGNPEMALGNAIGSVICDDGLALAICGILAPLPIMISPALLRTTGVFLIGVQLTVFFFTIFDYTLNRWEGAILVTLFAGYITFFFKKHRNAESEHEMGLIETASGLTDPLIKMFGLFVCALAGILIASEIVITSATAIARSLHIPEVIIAMTLVALGTSIPEVATCVTAARKGEGALAVGNILGADILNICWVAGASAIVNNLALGRKDILFMFPAMFIIVGVMLAALRINHSLTRRKAFVLLGLYGVYLLIFFIVFSPSLT